MDEAKNEDKGALSQPAQLEREIRRLHREVAHLKNAVAQEKIASTTILNQQKASTFIQRERERYLTLLLANSPSIILFLNQSGRIEFCTEYFIAKAGFANATEVLGHTLAEVLSPFMDSASQGKLLEYSRSAINENRPFSIDIPFDFARSGVAEDFAGLLVPMKDEKEQRTGIMLMFHDVTALKRSREEALAASTAKSVFLSSMSHEIRTPLNAIIGMTSIGKNATDLQRKDYAFEKIESASGHLLGVINDILDISKIESGKMELSPIVFDFHKMLDRVMTVISVKIQDKRQHFHMEIDPAIPDLLWGDDQRLAQVTANILANATKFTPEEGSIVLGARLLRMQDGVCVIQMSVKDSGIGMSPEEQGKLFRLFQQAEVGTTRKYGGSGLGLAISKRLLDLMDGDIWVESEKGRGSCFFFTATLGLPDRTAEAEDTGQADVIETDEADLSGRVILLVDDVEINLEIVVTLLEETKLTIDTAKSGREAVDAFAANPERYDLIFMDMQMPEIDGIQATRMIRALPVPQAATIPIIAMTANVFKEDIAKCLEAGMNGHLGKPFTKRDILKTLLQYMKPKQNSG